MKSVSDLTVLDELVTRLNALRPETERKWGTMTAGEMLCHLGDATSSVLGQPAPEDKPRPKRFLKWMALTLPLQWPHGLETPASVDPKREGTKPGNFEADRQRAIDGVRSFHAAPPAALTSSHGAFGPMTAADWKRWAYRHTDHHLKQFGI